MRFITVIVVVACAAAFLPSSARAQKAHIARVPFKAIIIEASGTTGKADVDDKLKDLKDALLAATKFKKFKLVESKTYSPPPDTQVNIPLPQGYTCVLVTQVAKVKGQDGSERLVTGLKVQVIHKSNKKKPLLTMTVVLKKGKPSFVEFPVAADNSFILCFIGG
jgi:hypothetical protein